MHAYVLEDAQAISRREIDAPAPEAGEVLVAVERAFGARGGAVSDPLKVQVEL
ncbi:MAG: hypothetical protein ACLFS5_12650 [Spirochaetaceae bacterium]